MQVSAEKPTATPSSSNQYVILTDLSLIYISRERCYVPDFCPASLCGEMLSSFVMRVTQSLRQGMYFCAVERIDLGREIQSRLLRAWFACLSDLESRNGKPWIMEVKAQAL
jgi:hypothetical protein